MLTGVNVASSSSAFEPHREHGTLCIGEIEIDRGRRVASVRGRALDLTPKEYLLLLELAEQLGRAVHYTRLLRRLWGVRNSRRNPKAVQVHVSRLRAKLGSALQLTTLHGWGYRLNAPAPLARDVVREARDAARTGREALEPGDRAPRD